MRILHICENLDDRYGGPAQSVGYLAGYTQGDCHSTLVSLSWRPHERNRVIERFGLEWLRFPVSLAGKIQYSTEYSNFMESLGSSDYDLIHIHSPWNMVPYIAYKVSLSKDIPFAFSVRGSLSNWSLSQRSLVKRTAMRLFKRSLLSQASLVHVTSEEEERDTLLVCGSARTSLVPNGIDVNDYPMAHATVRPNGPRKFLFLSRIHPKKGLYELLEAFSRLNSPDWMLTICGPVYDESYWRDVNELIVRKNISSCVKYIGEVYGADKVSIIHEHDFVVLTSHSENYGVVIAESMSCGRPVIVSNAMPWQIVSDRNAGFVVSMTDITSGLKAAIHLSQEDFSRMCSAARDIASSELDWSIQARKMTDAYRMALGR